VIDTLRRWQSEGGQEPKEMSFLIEHACRTLVKNGDEDALGLMGYGEAPQVTIENFETMTPSVVVGSAFEFSFELVAKAEQKLMVDYTMDFAGADGGQG